MVKAFSSGVIVMVDGTTKVSFEEEEEERKMWHRGINETEHLTFVYVLS